MYASLCGTPKTTKTDENGRKRTLAPSCTVALCDSQPVVTEFTVRRAAYSLGKSGRFASENWPSLPESIIHCTKTFTALYEPIICGYDWFLPARSVRWRRRGVSRVQNRAMCLGVSSPARHWHFADSKPGTLRLCKNLASPIRPVRGCTSSTLSALHSSLCNRKTFFVGAGSSIRSRP